MKIPLLSSILLLSLSTITFLSCNSEDNKSKKAPEDVCNIYDLHYGILQELVNAINYHETYEYHSYSVWDGTTIEEIKTRISKLNSLNCNSKKSLDFANNQIMKIQEFLTKKKQSQEDEELNGDDLFMSGVQISSSKTLFDENMNPYVELTVTNNTKKTISALRFLINYCPRNEENPVCYTFVLSKGNISPFSSKNLSFTLPSTIQKATDNPVIELFEILRNDGTKVKTADGLRFSIN